MQAMAITVFLIRRVVYVRCTLSAGMRLYTGNVDFIWQKRVFFTFVPYASSVNQLINLSFILLLRFSFCSHTFSLGLLYCAYVLTSRL